MTACQVSGHSVVEVTGPIELDDAGALRAVLLEALAGESLVVADLSEASVADVRGVGALAMVAHVADRMDRELRIASPSPMLRRVVELVGATGRLGMYPSVEAALDGAPRLGAPKMMASLS